MSTAQAVFMNQRSFTTFTVATGGTITTEGDFKVHTFTGSGTFQVTTLGTDDTVDAFVVGGGGATGQGGGGGGYAGDFSLA